jgi:hypothetical protein
VFRARPKRTLFGTFFDVQNLREVAARFAGLSTFESGTSPVHFLGACSAKARAAGEPGVRTRRRDHATRPRSRRDLEEESEAQEGQGVARSATNDDVTDRFDGKSLEDGVLGESRPSRDVGNGNAVREGWFEEEHQGGQGTG